ncbi:formate/nitrite transporter family protein, partial [Neisseria sicca]|uniref:formate/nitrite transporter family protein n=1 Tax=Neisseria sicca TaxID=490 RepID=UPI0034D9720B
MIPSPHLYPHQILHLLLHKTSPNPQSTIPTLPLFTLFPPPYIPFSYLPYFKLLTPIPHQSPAFPTFLPASIFPIPFISILLPSPDLLTSNIIIISLPPFPPPISTKILLRNSVLVSLLNLLPTLAMAFFLPHYLPITQASVPEKTIPLPQ